MRSLQSIVLALVFLLNTGLFAQQLGEMHGKVLDQQGLPLPGVLVSATSGGSIYRTGAEPDGKFVLKPIPFGTYNLRFISMGYDTLEMVNVIVVPERITFTPTVKMMESTTSFTYKPVVKVEYKVPLINRDGETVTTIRAKDLKNMPAGKGGSIKNIVAALNSDVKAGQNGELYFRGSRNGSAIYFIDGVKFKGMAPTIPGSGISSVSVYSGGLPAKYGDTTGGVVVIETKSYLDAWREKQDRLNGNVR